jgi:ribonuclease BN (tRNA processing enzyme)
VSEVRLRFLGTGDAFGSGGRLQTCFHVENGDLRFLIDCGASSVIAMNRGGIVPNLIDAILVTHLHGDHFGGVPFFLIDARHASKRERPLTLAGPPGLEKRLAEAMEALFPGSNDKPYDFPIRYVELRPRQRAEIGSLAVTAHAVVHPSGAPSYALRVECGGKTLAYSGDTEWTDELLDAARDTDLFICECFAYDQKVPYHIDYRTLLANRDRLTCRTLVLTHMSEAMLARLDSIDIECAEDGKTIIV